MEFSMFHVFQLSEFEVNERFFPCFAPQHVDLSNNPECRRCIQHGDENADFVHLSTRVLFAILTLLQTSSKHDVGQPAMAKGCVCYLPSWSHCCLRGVVGAFSLLVHSASFRSYVLYIQWSYNVWSGIECLCESAQTWAMKRNLKWEQYSTVQCFLSVSRMQWWFHLIFSSHGFWRGRTRRRRKGAVRLQLPFWHPMQWLTLLTKRVRMRPSVSALCRFLRRNSNRLTVTIFVDYGHPKEINKKNQVKDLWSLL